MRVCVLGPLEVVDGDRTVRLGGPKERAVLAVLAVNAGEVVSEPRLIDALWGDNPPRTASKTLQNYVLRLRKALRPGPSGPVRAGGAEGGDLAIETRAPGYVLRGGLEAVDVRIVEARLSRAREAREQGDHDTAAELLRGALGCWRGPSLVEFADQPFAMADAARLDELRQTVLEERIDTDLARGCHDDCVAELEALVTVHPLRERLWGQLMTALYRAGRQADALRAYQRARGTLVEELGIEPGPPLRDLERAVIEQDSSLDLPAAKRSGQPAGKMAQLPMPVPMLQPSGASFVGREREIGALLEAWGRAVDGQRQVVLVGGDPGVGKTSVAQSVAARLYTDGATVLSGRCDEELNVPYQPFTEALRWYVRSCPADQLAIRLGTLGAHLSRLVPELTTLLADDSPAVAADPETERYLLFEAVTEWLCAMTQDGPLLLVLDDLQWATKPTLLLLRHVIRTTPQSRLLVVGTYRSGDVTPASPLASTLADLRRETGVLRLDMAGLDETESLELLAVRAGHDLRDEDMSFARALHASTEGNPFFLGELLRDLIESGTVYRERGRWVSDPRYSQVDLPTGVREVLSQRLSRLSDAATRMLTVACLLGPSFTVDLLERLPEAADGPEMLLDALDEAVMAGVLAEPVHQLGHYAFSHALVHQFLRGRMTATRRAWLHRRIGTTRESLPDAEAHLGALAYHFAEAGDADKAAHYALRAGMQAVDQLAFEEAVSYLERGLEALPEGAECDRAQRAELLLHLAQARRLAGDVDGAKAAASEAAGDGRATGSAVHLAQAAMVHIDLGVAGQHDAIVEPLADEALARLSPEPSVLRVQLSARLALHRALWAGHGVRAAGLAQEALELARRLDDPEALQTALFARAVTLIGTDDVAQRLELVNELLAIGQSRGSLRMEARGLRVRATARLELGDVAGFDADRQRLDELATQLRHWLYRTDTFRWSVLRALLAGRFGEVDGLIAEMLVRGDRDPNTHNAAVVQTFYLCRDQGRLAEALPIIDQGLRRSPELVGFRALVMLAAAEAGEEAAARRHLEALAVDDFATLPRDFTWPALLSLLTEVVSAFGDRERAAVLLELLRPHAGRLVVVGWGDVCPGAADRYLGLLASTLQRWAEAEAYYDAALGLEEGIGADPLVARTRMAYARMLLARNQAGDCARAGELLAAALAEAERLGMAGLLAEGRSLASSTPETLTGIRPVR